MVLISGTLRGVWTGRKYPMVKSKILKKNIMNVSIFKNSIYLVPYAPDYNTKSILKLETWAKSKQQNYEQTTTITNLCLEVTRINQHVKTLQGLIIQSIVVKLNKKSLSKIQLQRCILDVQNVSNLASLEINFFKFISGVNWHFKINISYRHLHHSIYLEGEKFITLGGLLSASGACTIKHYSFVINGKCTYFAVSLCVLIWTNMPA